MEKINQFLTFRIKDEEYALCVSNVKEILEVPQITRIPRMPTYMRGVINLRGSVVPVIDLREKIRPRRHGNDGRNRNHRHRDSIQGRRERKTAHGGYLRRRGS